MSLEIKYGDGKRFRVLWNWYQPDRAQWILFDAETQQQLLKVDEDNDEVHGSDLVRLCDVLNRLAGDNGPTG